MATPKPKMKNIEPDILIINVIAKKTMEPLNFQFQMMYSIRQNKFC